MSAQQLITTEPRTEEPPTERTTVVERPATTRAPRTFRVADRSRLRNLFDHCNAVLVDPSDVDEL